MPSRRPSSILIPFTFSLLLFLSFFLFTIASDHDMHHIHVDDDDDDDGLEELLAIDKEVEEEEEEKGEQDVGQNSKPSEAEVLSKAQHIVVDLTNDNTKQIIDGNEYVLLLGFAPWCRRSAEMMPQFARAAAVLKEIGSSVLLAKLDAERYPKAARMLEIKGFPTLLLFDNGSARQYTGGFSWEEIVIWTRKKTGEPIIRLSSTTEVEDFLKKHQTFAIGFFKNFEGPDYEEFVKAAIDDNDFQFVETSNVEVAVVLFPDSKLDNHFLGLVKSEPERFTTFEDSFEESKILQFLAYNKFPLITVLSDLNSARFFSSPIKRQVYIFASADDFKNFHMLLQDVARKFKSKIIFVYADSADDNLAKPFLTLFGLESEEKPVVVAFDYANGSKYLLEFELTLINLEAFCSELSHGTLPPYYRSEPIPDTQGIVQVVVGRSFDAVVLSSPESVLLEVHTPWCMTCDEMSKEIEKLANEFKGVDNLIFARIDASSNEHPELQVNDFPTLLYYPSENKSNPIKLSKKSRLKDLITFINANLKTEERTLTSERITDEL